MSNLPESAARVFRTLEEALQQPEHGKTKDGQVKEWSVWRLTITRPIEPGEYFGWSGTGWVFGSRVMQDLGVEIALATSKRKPVDVKATLAAMSDEERAALFAEFGATTKKGKGK